MKVLMTATFLLLFLQLTFSWLFEVEPKVMASHTGNRQFSRDVDVGDFGPDDFTDAEILQSARTNPGSLDILLEILKAEKEFDGTIADLHQKAANNRRRYDILRRTTS